jgi:hypothetical protein
MKLVPYYFFISPHPGIKFYPCSYICPAFGFWEIYMYKTDIMVGGGGLVL